MEEFVHLARSVTVSAPIPSPLKFELADLALLARIQDAMGIGVIFDWDGVVIDSRRQHELSWERLADEEDRDLPEGYFLKSFGRVNQHIIPDLLKWSSDPEEIQRLSDRKESLYREIMAAEAPPEPLAGVRELLVSLRQAEIPRIIGTSTPRANIDFALELLGLSEFFADAVTAEDVTRGKPDPEVFLKAADKMGLDPAACAVIEDTGHGIEAARAAGMKGIAVLTTHGKKELAEAGADLILTSLRELDVQLLRSLFHR